MCRSLNYNTLSRFFIKYPIYKDKRMKSLANLNLLQELMTILPLPN